MTTHTELDSVSVSTDKEINFSALRDKVNRLEKEKQDLELALDHKTRATQSDFSSSLLKEAGINYDEPYVETSKLASVIAAMERHNEDKTQQIVANALSEYQSKNMYTYMQAETGGQYSKVVTDEALRKLQEQEPEIMIAVAALDKDPAAKASYLYKKCLRDQEQEASVKKSKERMNSSMRMYSDYSPTSQAAGFNVEDTDSILSKFAPRGTPENVEQIRKFISTMPKPQNSLIQ